MPEGGFAGGIPIFTTCHSPSDSAAIQVTPGCSRASSSRLLSASSRVMQTGYEGRERRALASLEGMALLLIAVFIVVPIIELYVIIQVGGSIGAGPTIFLLLLDSIIGSLLLRSQGRSAWVSLNRALAESRIPAKEVLDGVLIIFGGALLLTPGFITDIFGLLLLIPPTRAIVRGFLKRFVGARYTVGPRAAAWGYGRVQGRRASAADRAEPTQGPGRVADEEPLRQDPIFGSFDWTNSERGRKPDDIEGTAHEVRDDEGLPPGEGRGSFPG